MKKYGDRVLRLDEFIAACLLIEVTWRALWGKNLLLVVSAVTLLIAIINPVGIAGIEFSGRLALCAFVGLVMTTYSVIYGSYIVVRLARFGVPIAYSSQVGAVVVCLLHNPLFLAIFPESEFLSHGYWANFGLTFLILSIISCCVTYLFHQSLKSETEILIAPFLAPSAPQTAPMKPEKLQTMLHPPLRGTVLAITVEDNYVRIETSKGDQLLHLSLAAAISKLNEGQGIRVHRSIWLNWIKMDRLFYENGNPRLLTKNGVVLPVSRTKVEAIKEGLSAEFTRSERFQSSD